jgi:hypothetical protein
MYDESQCWLIHTKTPSCRSIDYYTHPNHSAKTLKMIKRQSFRRNVGKLVFNIDVGHNNLTIVIFLLDVVVYDVNLLGMSIELFCTNQIVIWLSFHNLVKAICPYPKSPNNLCIQMISLIVACATIYSAFVVFPTLQSCFREPHATWT